MPGFSTFWNLVDQEEQEAVLLSWAVASLFCLLLPLGLRADNRVSGIRFSLGVVVENVGKRRTAGASSWEATR